MAAGTELEADTRPQAVSFSNEERAELIGALTNAVLVADGLLEAFRLTKGLEWKVPPTEQQTLLFAF
jgi:hypothetical protein